MKPSKLKNLLYNSAATGHKMKKNVDRNYVEDFQLRSIWLLFYFLFEENMLECPSTSLISGIEFTYYFRSAE